MLSFPAAHEMFGSGEEFCRMDAMHRQVLFWAVCHRNVFGVSQHVSFSLWNILQNFDKIFHTENIAVVRPVIGGVIALWAFVRGVSKVYHANVNFGVAAPMGRGAVYVLEAPLRIVVQSGSVLLMFLPVVDDEKRAGVEAIGSLLFNDQKQSLQLQHDGLQQVCSEVVPIVKELVEGLPEAFRGEFPSIILIFAKKLARVSLVNLE